MMKNKKVKCAVWALIIALFMVGAGYLIIDQNKTIPATNNAEPKIVRNNTVDNIVFDDTKVNVYIFYGDGCEHCNEEFDFLESIYNDYGEYCNFYSLEVWANDSNASLMNDLAVMNNEIVSGVPYTIIGDKSFVGFNESMEEDMKNEIMNQYQNKSEHPDIYKTYLNNVQV